MWRWLFLRKGVLTGAPAVRRIKTYSAQSGYAYQYFYQGRRAFRQAGAAGTEFVFSVCSDGRVWSPVGIPIADSAVAEWQEGHQRELSSTEVYALAKMALFQAFDERANPDRIHGDVQVSAVDIEAIAATLGFD